MRRIYCIPTALIISSIFQAPIHAQTPDEEAELASVYGDKLNVSIATGSQQLLRRAPAVATVITAEDIKTMGATDLSSVLSLVPGMHVNRHNTSNNPLFIIRGIFSSQNAQTLYMQDGIPLTQGFQSNKGNAFTSQGLENIARIEIIRGPGSALYGADAYAGVINVITKTAADISGARFGTRISSFDTRDVWVQYGGHIGPVEVAAHLQAGSTKGFKRLIEKDAQTANDNTFKTNASLAPGTTNTGYDLLDANIDLALDKWRWRIGLRSRDNIGTYAGVNSALDPVGKLKNIRTNSDLSWTAPQFTPDWGLGLSAAYTHQSDLIPTVLDLFPPGARLATGLFPNGLLGAPERKERQFRFSFFATYSGIAKNRLRIGIGHDDINLYETRERKNFIFSSTGVPLPLPELVDVSESAPFLRPQRRKNNYIYLQDEWNFTNDWTLTAGLRRDRFSDFGGTTNPRLALVWDTSATVTTKFLFGQAFRAPSFNETYSTGNPVNQGNLNIRPETIKTLEAAVSWQTTKDILLNVNLFKYSAKSIIRTVPNSEITGNPLATGATFQNRGSQDGSGLEFEMNWDVSRKLRITGNYAYQVSKDKTTGLDAGYSPHHSIAGRADWSFVNGWILDTRINWVADRKRGVGDRRTTNVPNYNTVDFSVRTTTIKNWEFSAGVNNLFNADVREPSLAPGTALPNDLPQAGRSVYLQAVFKM